MRGRVCESEKGVKGENVEEGMREAADPLSLIHPYLTLTPSLTSVYKEWKGSRVREKRYEPGICA